MEFFDNHKKLFLTAGAFFLVLTIFVAILPALHNQTINAPLPGEEPLSPEAKKGKAVYIANGCVACHTQQVRNIEMDRLWGSRPSLASDYASEIRTDFWRNTATLMGTERTGPDLTDVGNRQPSTDWNLLHLFNPRIVVKESIMPSYPYLFDYKNDLDKGDVEVNIPEQFKPAGDLKVVASSKVLHLLAYLKSLKQTELPQDTPAPQFLYSKQQSQTASNTAGGNSSEKIDGEVLYQTHCQACHQADGNGLPGAFPPLKGSAIVASEDLRLYVDIIMNGYDSRPEFGVMSAVGSSAALNEMQVAAIINFERNSWGNSGNQVSPEQVKKIMDSIQKQID